MNDKKEHKTRKDVINMFKFAQLKIVVTIPQNLKTLSQHGISLLINYENMMISDTFCQTDYDQYINRISSAFGPIYEGKTISLVTPS